MFSPRVPGVLGPQSDTPQPQGGIGMPVDRIWNRPMFSPQGLMPTAHNLPAAGDRLNRSGNNLIGQQPGFNPGVGVQLPTGSTLVREQHRYANVVELILPAGVASAQALAAPVGLRNFLLVRNVSPAAEIIYISFGVQATTQSPLRLTAGQAALFDTVVPQNEMYVISDTATGVLAVGYSQFSPQ